jgi:hypothetical protein
LSAQINTIYATSVLAYFKEMGHEHKAPLVRISGEMKCPWDWYTIRSDLRTSVSRVLFPTVNKLNVWEKGKGEHDNDYHVCRLFDVQGVRL